MLTPFFYAETLSGSTGAMTWDEQGKFIVVTTWFIPHVASVDSAETIVNRYGLYVASNIGCNRLLFEFDNWFAVEIFQMEEESFRPKVVILECK